MNMIFKTLNSINNFSKKIIFIASSFVLCACILGICLIAYNATFGNDVQLFEIGSTLIKKSCIAFTEFVSCALVIDFIGRNFQNDD